MSDSVSTSLPARGPLLGLDYGSKRVGVAVSDLYPAISLNGEIFHAAENFGDLFRGTSSAGNIGPLASTWRLWLS